MKIVEIHSLADFTNGRTIWNDILDRYDHSVFSTWEWLSNWWKHFGNDRRLALLLAESGNDIRGIAPLMYSVHRMFGLRQGKIEFVGTPDADYHEFLLDKNDKECVKLFIEYVKNAFDRWNCIELVDIPEGASFLPALREISRVLEPNHMCPYIRLPESYDAFLSTLSSRKRKNLRHSSNLLHRRYDVELIDCSRSELIYDGMNTFFQLHQQRWESAGSHGVFANSKHRSFHLDIARSFSKRGWLGLFLLKLSGTPVAAHYGFKYKGKFFYYLSGIDPKYYRLSVGAILTSLVIADCIENGFREFDFMRGAEEYKSHWNTQNRWNHKAIIARQGLLEDMKYRLYNAYWFQANRLKYVVNNAPRNLSEALNNQPMFLAKRRPNQPIAKRGRPLERI
jgi:CelD/BcsL family acetyltransferase involved in cellulose biosynthesis